MESPKDINAIIDKLNKDLPLHSMWDGFWISRFKNKELYIACSFDRTYYKNYDIVFKEVIFFNLPSEWRDTDIYSDSLIRLSTIIEFNEQHSHFNTSDYNIFAIDIHFNSKKYVFYVVAKQVYLFKCDGPNCFPEVDYKDQYESEAFPCMKNRV